MSLLQKKDFRQNYKKMRIVLVYPNQTELDDLLDRYRYLPGDGPEPFVPLGMLYLCSNVGHQVKFIDNSIKKFTKEKLFQEIMDFKPDIVGFGGTMMEWVQARKVAKLLKEVNIPTIYGGPNATVNSEKHIRYFDYIIRAEGEITLKELLDCLEKDGDLGKVKGLWFRVGSKTVKNPDRPFIEDLDAVNYPDRDIINLYEYSREAGFPTAKPADIVVSSRGCPYDCHFCSSKYFWKQTYRTREVREVIKEIRFMMDRYGTKAIHFREDNFTVQRGRVLKFCEELERIGMEWVCQSRVDDIDKELVERMKDSGCQGICFGFESANDHTLEYLKKGVTVSQSIRAIDICEKIGMNWSGGFMVGVLNETREDINNTLKFVEKIRRKSYSFLPPGAGRFLGFPVSETYFEMERNGLVEFSWEDGELLIPGTYHLSADEVEETIRKDEVSRMGMGWRAKEFIKLILKILLPRFIFKKLRKIYRAVPYIHLRTLFFGLFKCF